jgi:Tol biopolymer transport system component
MTIAAGTRIGAYEILSLLGAGAMGSVYRARDVRVGREVAIKFSSGHFTERFAREALAIAALNHPNICHLYDVGDNYLVMELVPGESADGPFPLPVAIKYALQVADALDAAHEKGIVHRDLKPANVRIRPDGVVKVLDFGLATQLVDTAGSGDVSGLLTAAIEGTLSGMIVGTAAYMAPEQAQGKPVDKRADIWAFGVVLYEWLTGDRAFAGRSFAETVAAVLTRDPDWDRVPTRARALLQRCLAKDPKQRLRDIGDVAALLEAAQPETAPQRSSTSWLPWSVAGVSIAAMIAMAMWATRATPPTAGNTAVQRWDVEAEALAERGFTLSRDGRRLAYVPRTDPQERLWVRDLAQPDARPILGTDKGRRPIFSPDGEWLAYFTGQARAGHLYKVPIAGGSFNTRGAAVMLCDDANAYGGSWGDDNRIIFSGRSGLVRVNASGGACESITKVDPAEGDHRWAQILPGGTRVLISVGKEGAFDSARIAVVDLATGRHRTVIEGGANARYVPSGHLVFVRGGEMLAVRFDLRTLTVSGVPRVVVQSVFHVNAGGFAAYTFADTGLLVYSSPPIQGFEWRDRHGKAETIAVTPGMYPFFDLSPDGTRLALQQAGRGDIEIVSLTGGPSERVTSEGMNYTPVWSANGRTVTYGALGNGIFQTTLDPRGTRRIVTEGQSPAAPLAWTSDGRTLVYTAGDPLGLWTVTQLADGTMDEPRPLVVDQAVSNSTAKLSPDDRWLAYQSARPGQPPRVYVRPFTGPGGTVLVSNDEGSIPRWSRDGHELFYLGPNRALMGVEVRTTPTFAVGSPRIVLPSAGRFDVDPSGQRFLVAARETAGLHVVTNWFAEVREKTERPN